MPFLHKHFLEATAGCWHVTILDKSSAITQVFPGMTLTKTETNRAKNSYEHDKWKCQLYWKGELKPLFFCGVQITTFW